MGLRCSSVRSDAAGDDRGCRSAQTSGFCGSSAGRRRQLENRSGSGTRIFLSAGRGGTGSSRRTDGDLSQATQPHPQRLGLGNRSGATLRCGGGGDCRDRRLACSSRCSAAAVGGRNRWSDRFAGPADAACCQVSRCSASRYQVRRHGCAARPATPRARKFCRCPLARFHLAWPGRSTIASRTGALSRRCLRRQSRGRNRCSSAVSTCGSSRA